MKTFPIIFFAILFTTLSVNAQFSLGADLSFGTNSATIKDDNGTPSSQNIQADGLTSKEENKSFLALKLNAIYEIDDKWSARSGLWLNRESYAIRNVDGNYTGASVYHTTNIEIPLLAEYTFEDLLGDWNLNTFGGFGVNLKIAESLDGSDGAHFWNLAKNLTENDPTRGINGSRTEEKLFAPVDISILLGANLEHDISDKLSFVGGLSFDFGMLSAINPKLTHSNGTDVSDPESTVWRSNIVAIDLGVRMTLD